MLLVFFHESVFPQPQSIPLRPFQIFSKIRGDIRKSRCTTGINDTGGKFDTGGKITTGINDIGGKFATGINDTGGKFLNQILVANLPPVSTIPTANVPPLLLTGATGVTTGINDINDTGGEFATGVNDTGGKQWNQLSNC